MQDSPSRMPSLLVMKVPSNLLMLLMSNPPFSVPHRNLKVKNYVYVVFGFANKYLCDDGVVILFHDDDPIVFRLIKSFFENNGYVIHLKWAVINIVPYMNHDMKRKTVMFFPH